MIDLHDVYPPQPGSVSFTPAERDALNDPNSNSTFERIAATGARVGDFLGNISAVDQAAGLKIISELKGEIEEPIPRSLRRKVFVDKATAAFVAASVEKGAIV